MNAPTSSRGELIKALERRLPAVLALDLTDEFLELREDVATKTLGRSAAGKFVESAVQTLQWILDGRYDSAPRVDGFLRTLESRSPLDDGFRCAARTLRAMYSLRNKRSISHKGSVDPNSYDLRFLLSGSQWVLSEIIRSVTGLTMEEAGRLIDTVQVPVYDLVQEFAGKRLVLRSDLSAEAELLILLHGVYPEPALIRELVQWADRRNPKTVRNAIRILWARRWVEGSGTSGYVLTRAGIAEARKQVVARAA
jgi:hypothetical protein